MLAIETLKATCAVCNKLVDKMFWLDDFASNNKICVVQCHGQEEFCKLDKQMVEDIAYNKIVSITAFATKQIDQIKLIGDK
jgi:hypothetical protein